MRPSVGSDGPVVDSRWLPLAQEKGAASSPVALGAVSDRSEEEGRVVGVEVRC
jgi:hypothetical protein